MTVLYGDSGKVAYGALKQFTLALPTPRETSVSITLPTTEPGTAQIAYTVQDADLASFSGNKSMLTATPYVVACGKIGAAATTLNYRLLVNGASQVQASNASVTAGNFYTYTFLRFINVSPSDLVEVKLWSNQADTTLVYHAFTTLWTRPQPTKAGTILKDVTYGTSTAFPTLATPPTPAVVVAQQFGVVSIASNISPQLPNTSAVTITSLIPDVNFGIIRSGYGDQIATVQFQNSATNQCQYFKNNYSSSITFREVLR